jgi:hypothetical protein
MAGFSDYLESALLNAVFRNTSYTSPATVYVALYTAAPSDAGGGTEVTGNGYSRQSASFNAPSGGSIANTGAVTFTASGGAWGTVSHFGVFDASSGGNLLAWNSLNASKTIADGDSAEFASGALTISLD